MKKFNFIEFYNNIQKDLLNVNRLISVIENVEWAEMHFHGTESEYDEEKELTKEKLVGALELIVLKIDFVHEYLGLPKMSEKLNAELKKHEGKFGELKYDPFIDIFDCPVKWILIKHLDILTSHVKIDSKYEYENQKILLERILRGTPKILSDRQIEPANEAEVRKAVYQILIHIFPDTVREFSIPKVSGTYKPDIGIKSLKCAIEYKFVDSKAKVKIAIGGVFEDINGYEGSEDWKIYYAVFYMTDHFITQEQVEAEFQLSNVPHHWKPIVVFGKGNRKEQDMKRENKNGS